MSVLRGLPLGVAIFYGFISLPDMAVRFKWRCNVILNSCIPWFIAGIQFPPLAYYISAFLLGILQLKRTLYTQS
jgi:hypothetical protein